MDLLVIGKNNYNSIVCVGHIHVMMESALQTVTKPIWIFFTLLCKSPFKLAAATPPHYPTPQTLSSLAWDKLLRIGRRSAPPRLTSFQIVDFSIVSGPHLDGRALCQKIHRANVLATEEGDFQLASTRTEPRRNNKINLVYQLTQRCSTSHQSLKEEVIVNPQK